MLPQELIQRLRRIEIKTSKLANEKMAGQYRSVFKGHGMSFAEVRPYQQGDDVRLIDWNVSARTGEPFIKVFEEERELTVFLLLDLSASTQFGTHLSTRKQVITEIAAMMAFSAIRNNDRVGLIIFTDSVEYFVPPRKGKTHVLRVIRDILTFEPTGKGRTSDGVAEAMKYLTKISKKTTVTFLLSDFFIPQREFPAVERPLAIASQRHDIIPVMVRDPMDQALPKIGLAPMEDLETGSVRLVDTSSAMVRRDFARAALQQRAHVISLFRRLSLDSVEVGTEEGDYLKKFNQLFSRRAKRF